MASYDDDDSRPASLPPLFTPHIDTCLRGHSEITFWVGASAGCFEESALGEGKVLEVGRPAATDTPLSFPDLFKGFVQPLVPAGKHRVARGMGKVGVVWAWRWCIGGVSSQYSRYPPVSNSRLNNACITIERKEWCKRGEE
ncbi:hypothetical protein PoB_003843600 [Plakobranchus ocellatus]|uniref:Uncharacterized protein n=1 Tax=Plakobranchus ocellatus TaxID=259542 RepID=A0AAV4AUW4_9GAST|nr:hypothetical protein PoB_003843600 [Plakobranchus ocellatus]